MKPPLIVGRRYSIYGVGEYEILARSSYKLQREDDTDTTWHSWVIANVDKQPGAPNECLVYWPEFGFCIGKPVDAADKPVWAKLYPYRCGNVVANQQHYFNLDLRTAGESVRTRRVMRCWLDNGPITDSQKVCISTVFWTSETFVDVPNGEENDYPEKLYLKIERVFLPSA